MMTRINEQLQLKTALFLTTTLLFLPSHCLEELFFEEPSLTFHQNALNSVERTSNTVVNEEKMCL